MDAHPAIVIERVERRDIRAEVIEQVARLLARADRKNPDDNAQCNSPSGGQMVVQCTLMAMPYPTDRVWYSYRDRAEELLRQAFKPAGL